MGKREVFSSLKCSRLFRDRLILLKCSSMKQLWFHMPLRLTTGWHKKSLFNQAREVCRSNFPRTREVSPKTSYRPCLLQQATWDRCGSMEKLLKSHSLHHKSHFLAIMG